MALAISYGKSSREAQPVALCAGELSASTQMADLQAALNGSTPLPTSPFRPPKDSVHLSHVKSSLVHALILMQRAMEGGKPAPGSSCLLVARWEWAVSASAAWEAAASARPGPEQEAAKSRALTVTRAVTPRVLFGMSNEAAWDTRAGLGNNDECPQRKLNEVFKTLNQGNSPQQTARITGIEFCDKAEYEVLGCVFEYWIIKLNKAPLSCRAAIVHCAQLGITRKVRGFVSEHQKRSVFSGAVYKPPDNLTLLLETALLKELRGEMRLKKIATKKEKHKLRHRQKRQQLRQSLNGGGGGGDTGDSKAPDGAGRSGSPVAADAARDGTGGKVLASFKAALVEHVWIAKAKDSRSLG